MQLCLAGRGQRVPHHGNRPLRGEHCVLRAIDLPFVVGGDFNLAGDVLEQSGWLHTVRARIAAPSNATPTCLYSTGKGRVIGFFVVSEELHSFVKEVGVDDSPTAGRGNAGGSETHAARPKATQGCQAPKGCTNWAFGENPELRCGAPHGENVRRVARRCGAHSAGRGGSVVETHCGTVAVPTT